MARPLSILWYKRDLRIHDHLPLAQAAQRGAVLPLYIVEPELWQQADASARHWAFIAESLTELRAELAKLGQPLVLRIGGAVEVFESLRLELGPFHLFSHEETGNGWTYARDLRVGEWARAQGIPWTEMQGAGVIRRLGGRTGWARRWDGHMSQPQTPPPAGLMPLGTAPQAIPTASDLGLAPDPCPDRQRGGRRAALETLGSFLIERGAPYRRAMSGPEAGAQHCSRLSPHLAYGTLSMREAAQAAWARQRELKATGQRGGWRGAMSSFQGRLHWRDHFTQKLEDAPGIEHSNLHRAYDGLRPSTPDPVRLQAWAEGQTGFPFVDACMRALMATGWMNFRMRAMLMSFASYHLWLDWRAPGLQLARYFTDYEPGIHWPQVQMQSGTTGINTIRIYNPVKQGLDQDPEGTFIRKWVPELGAVPSSHLHTPWLWEGAGQILGRDYPEPIVDYKTAGKAARDAVWAVRKRPEFRAQASAIQHKHGSRKSGIKNRGQRRKKSDSRQMELPL